MHAIAWIFPNFLKEVTRGYSLYQITPPCVTSSLLKPVVVVVVYFSLTLIFPLRFSTLKLLITIWKNYYCLRIFRRNTTTPKLKVKLSSPDHFIGSRTVQFFFRFISAIFDRMFLLKYPIKVNIILFGKFLHIGAMEFQLISHLSKKKAGKDFLFEQLLVYLNFPNLSFSLCSYSWKKEGKLYYTWKGTYEQNRNI